MQTLYKHRNKILLLIIILLSIPFILNIGLDLDEPFTMGLINHNYSDIINLTKLDIHPPLYYLVLKLFLQITTFWTSNIFIKIIFARILSFILGLLACIYLSNSLSLLGIKVNKYLGIFLYILLPLGLGKYNQLTNIRMYSLSILLVSMEIYYILKLNRDSKVKYKIILLISVCLTLYTDYFAALIAGIYMLLFTLTYIIKKDWKHTKDMFLIGCIDIILFIPWIPSLLNQLSMQFKNSYVTHSLLTANTKFSIKLIVLSIIINVIFYRKYRENSLLKISIINLSITLCILTIYSQLTLPFPVPRYLSPIVQPIFFFVSYAIIYFYHRNIKGKLITLILLMFLTINYSSSCYRVILHFDIPSISFMQKFKAISNSHNTNVNANASGIEEYRWNATGQGSGGGGGNSIYLLSIHKNISDKNYVSTYKIIGNGNEKLFKAVFPNIEHYSTK